MASVTPLCTGSIEMDRSVLLAGTAGEQTVAPVIVYLIEGAETVLVDTGFGDVDRMNRLHAGFTCRRPDDQTIPRVLESQNCAPPDIDHVVLSHLHWDHCDNLDLFSNAEIHVPRAELEYAIAPEPMHADGYDAKSLGREPPWLRVQMTPMSGETNICEDVTAFPTPGHSVGHMSVAVETAGETTVVAVDAIPTFENLAGGPDSPYTLGSAVDEFDWWESAHAVDRRADKVLPGHEWEILDASPPPSAGE